MNTELGSRHCYWCAISESRRGLVIAFFISLAAHLFILGVIIELGSIDQQNKPKRIVNPRIVLESLVIITPK